MENLDESGQTFVQLFRSRVLLNQCTVRIERDLIIQLSAGFYRFTYMYFFEILTNKKDYCILLFLYGKKYCILFFTCFFYCSKYADKK